MLLITNARGNSAQFVELLLFTVMFPSVAALLFDALGKLFIFTVLVHFILFCEIKPKYMNSGCSASPSEWFA